MWSGRKKRRNERSPIPFRHTECTANLRWSGRFARACRRTLFHRCHTHHPYIGYFHHRGFSDHHRRLRRRLRRFDRPQDHRLHRHYCQCRDHPGRWEVVEVCLFAVEGSYRLPEEYFQAYAEHKEHIAEQSRTHPRSEGVKDKDLQYGNSIRFCPAQGIFY